MAPSNGAEAPVQTPPEGGVRTSRVHFLAVAPSSLEGSQAGQTKEATPVERLLDLLGPTTVGEADLVEQMRQISDKTLGAYLDGRGFDPSQAAAYLAKGNANA
jgi:hypothetical protein